MYALNPTHTFQLLLAVADVARIAAWYTFLLVLIIWPGSPDALAQVRSLIVAAICLVAFGFLANLLQALDWFVLGDPARLARIDYLALAIFALVLVETLFRNLPAEARWNIKPLCIGLAGAFAFDIYVYSDAVLFNRIDVDVFNVRPLVHAAVIPLLAITAVRRGRWSPKLTLSHRVVYQSIALLSSGIYLLLLSGAAYYVRLFGGEWGRVLQAVLLFAGLVAFCVLVLSGSMRSRLRVFIGKHFFRYRFDYRDQWLRFTQTLTSSDAQAALGQQIIRGLANMVESPSGALWLRPHGSSAYGQSARWNMPAQPTPEPADGSLARFLASTGWVVNLEEYRSVPGRYEDLQLPRWLSEMSDAWLIVPLNTGDEMIGFVMLGSPRVRVEANWEVHDLLKTAGRQAASFLGHMQATEALLETRKFDAFNRMSAFVVHDLKNIVSQLSLMLRNAERHKSNPEFQNDMLMTVGHAVDRMKQLMMQLREGTTPMNSPHAVNLSEVIRRIQRNKSSHEPVPELNLEEHVMARAHEDRVERVIGHIVQNAIDATQKDGRVCVRLGRQDGRAVIEVSDTGHGMTADFVRERLFKPFQTTKESGMGIGAYESYQYVQELGGDIVVESSVGAGTVMRVLLPLAENDLTRASKAAA